MQAILDSESEDNVDDGINYKNIVNDDLKDFLSKIENHVQAEQKILDAWIDKDEKHGGPAKGIRTPAATGAKSKAALAS